MADAARAVDGRNVGHAAGEGSEEEVVVGGESGCGCESWTGQIDGLHARSYAVP